jgi:hypothetical protein
MEKDLSPKRRLGDRSARFCSMFFRGPKRSLGKMSDTFWRSNICAPSRANQRAWLDLSGEERSVKNLPKPTIILMLAYILLL